MADEEYQPTEQELDRLDRAGISAALSKLEALNTENIRDADGVMVCLSAFSAARSAYSNEVDRMSSEIGEGSVVDAYPDVTGMVMAGMLCHIFGASPDEVSPSCEFAQKIKYLVNACIAMNSISTAQMQFDSCEDAMIGASLADEAMALGRANEERFGDG